MEKKESVSNPKISDWMTCLSLYCRRGRGCKQIGWGRKDRYYWV